MTRVPVTDFLVSILVAGAVLPAVLDYRAR
jgi:hypothetical protein